MAIGITRAVGTLSSHYTSVIKQSPPKFMPIIVSYLSIWFIPFLLFSPYIFGFGFEFGYDTRIGICDWKTGEGINSLKDRTTLEIIYLAIILGVALISVLLIVTSYVYLGLFIKKEISEISGITQVINVSMC